MFPFPRCSLEYCSREEQQRGVGGICKRVLGKQFCFHDSLEGPPNHQGSHSCCSQSTAPLHPMQWLVLTHHFPNQGQNALSSAW